MPAARGKTSTPHLEHLKGVKPPSFIQLESLADVARLACALERAPLPLFAINSPAGIMIATQIDIFLGVPVFYYALSNEVRHYLSYKTTAIGEEVLLQDSPGNPTFVHAPVIDVVKLPAVFERGLGKIGKHDGEKFLSIQVRDLVSLVKVASYKIMFEEPPLPIFAFPKEKGLAKWRLGAFTRIEEYEEASIFFFFEQESAPQHNFVKSSMTKPEASFTNRTDEHGSLYVKIVRLKEPHPLVEAD